METKTLTKKRIWEIDFLRGFAICLMILDHLCYDFLYLPNFFTNYYEINNPFITWCVDNIGPIFFNDIKIAFHYIFVAIFLLLVGISCHFSKSNLKRGLMLLGVQIVFSLVMEGLSIYTKENLRVTFGILYVISFSILITCLIDLIPYKKWIYLTLGIIIPILGIIFNMYMPPYVYELNASNWWQVLLGLRSYGADYFSIIPYIGFVFLGKFIGEVFYDKRKSLLPKLDGVWNKPICFIGRHSIIFYLLHQVVLVALLGIICLSLGYTLF